jgi:hypothetical protein
MLPVDQRSPVRGDVGQEHAQLAILDPPGGAGVLPLYARGLGSLLEEPGLVGDHHSRRVAELVEHIAAQVIAHLGGVPPVEVQQPLHAVRAQLTGLLGDRPGVLALRAREQPEQIQPRPAPRVCLREPAGYQRERFIEPGLPPSKAVIDYRPGRGHRVFFEIQHTLKLTTRWPPP